MFTVVNEWVAHVTHIFAQSLKNIYIISIIFGVNDFSIAQNEKKYFASFESRSMGLSQMPLHYKIGLPSLKQDNFTLWHFISVESNRILSPAIGVGKGYIGRGFQIPGSMFLLGEFQLRYVTPKYKEIYPTLMHLSKLGLGYRFQRPVSLTLMMSFDNEWSFFTEFGLLYPIICKPKPTLRRQLRCP